MSVKWRSIFNKETEMANGTKAAKLRKYFEKNPDATTKQAAEWANCSYGNAYAIKRKLCEEAVTSSEEQATPTNTHVTVEKYVASTPTAMLGSGQTSDGSTASYYELPDGAKELQDLISFKDMNAQMGEIFRGTYRYGEASHSDRLRDAKKIRFYIDAEIKRLGG
jgi:hypothetical protein